MDLKKMNRGIIFFCVGPHCWGCAVTVSQAIKNARQAKPSWIKKFEYNVFMVSDGTWIDDFGRLFNDSENRIEPVLVDTNIKDRVKELQSIRDLYRKENNMEPCEH